MIRLLTSVSLLLRPIPSRSGRRCVMLRPPPGMRSQTPAASKNCILGSLPEVPAGKIFVIQTAIGRCASTDQTARFLTPGRVINQGASATLVTALPLGCAVIAGPVVEQQMAATNLFIVAKGSNDPRQLTVTFERAAGTQSSQCRLYAHGYWLP